MKLKGQWTSPERCPRCGRKWEWFSVDVGTHWDKRPIYAYDQADCEHCGLHITIDVPLPDFEEDEK